MANHAQHMRNGTLGKEGRQKRAISRFEMVLATGKKLHGTGIYDAKGLEGIKQLADNTRKNLGIATE